jgi:hypothetical protein
MEVERRKSRGVEVEGRPSQFGVGVAVGSEGDVDSVRRSLENSSRKPGNSSRDTKQPVIRRESLEIRRETLKGLEICRKPVKSSEIRCKALKAGLLGAHSENYEP